MAQRLNTAFEYQLLYIEFESFSDPTSFQLQSENITLPNNSRMPSHAGVVMLPE